MEDQIANRAKKKLKTSLPFSFLCSKPRNRRGADRPPPCRPPRWPEIALGVQLERRWGSAAGVGGWDREAAAKRLGFPWLFFFCCVFGLGMFWVNWASIG
ncbi:hypothetical protein V6Z11_A04G021400 [Gossypium hirsutum]